MTVRRAMVAMVALSAVGVQSLTGCGPNDAEVQASLAAEPQAPSMPPRDQVTAIGQETWRVPVGITEAVSYAVGHTGSTFLLAVLADDGITTTSGDVRTGTGAEGFALPAGSGWPVITGDEADPSIIAAVPPAPGDPVSSVTAWNRAGTPSWQRDAAALGTAAGTPLRVDVAESDRVVVRTADGAATPYQDTELWLLDAADGSTVWGTPGGATVRWAEARHGLLMYAWRSDAADDQPNDRITVRTLAEGSEVSTTTVLSNYGGGTRLDTQCGGIVTPDRIVMCRWQGADRAVLLADASGQVLAEWPATELPLIDPDAGVVVLTVPGDVGGMLGVDATTGTELWRYSPSELRDSGLVLDQAANGVLLGSSGKKNVAVSSRTGQWLVREVFDYLRPGAAIGDRVVGFQGGDAIGFTAPGVGIATLQDDDDSVLFVRP